MVAALPLVDLVIPSGLWRKIVATLIGIGILGWVTAWYFGKLDAQNSN